MRDAMSGGRLLRALGMVYLLLQAACDQCAGLPGEQKAQCCSEDAQAPSCAVEKPAVPECGAEAKDVGSACGLSDGEPSTFTLDPQDPEQQSRFFAFPTCSSCRSMVVTVAPESSEAADDPAPLNVVVMSSQSEAVAGFSPGSDWSGESRHVLGVASDSTYYVRVHADTGSATKYRLTAAGLGDLVELEPNDSVEAATSISFGLSIEGDHAGVDSAKADVDYFELNNDSSSGTLVVHSRLLTSGDRGSAPMIAVTDSAGRIVAGERAIVGSGLDIAVGLAAEARYFLRVTNPIASLVEPRQRYRLELQTREDLFEKEPNDTAPNAQLLEPEQPIEGGYSASAEQVDDDVFKVAIPGGSTQIGVEVSVTTTPNEGGSALGSLELTLLDDAEMQLTTEAIAPSSSASVESQLTGQPFVLIRARMSASFAGEQYRLTASFR